MNWKLIAVLFVAALAEAQPPGGGPPGGGGAGAGSGDGIWTRNAAFGESESFDGCNAHQPQSGQYHNHVNPICLRALLNDNVVIGDTGRTGTQYSELASGWTHSPILGWAYDGYPVYGPYGYSDPADPTSPIKRIRPSFQLRTITQRNTLPDWVMSYEPSGTSQTLTSSQYGPDVSADYPLGRYVQDYDFVAGLGDLDQYNGRFTVTPDFPNGTYAYFVTINDDGTPAFPYIINVQFYGTASSSRATVPSDAIDYFTSGALTQPASSDPRLATWYTQGSQQYAQAISAFDPSAGPSTTWPNDKPSGVTISGGVSTPALADVQRIRYNDSAVYVNSNNLPSYVIGPWFDGSMTAGVFVNWAASNTMVAQINRNPAPAATKAASGMGPVGIWVNGVAIFNVLDGASYSHSSGSDAGGGGVGPHVMSTSAASQERGPLAAGSLATAFPKFNSVVATSTDTASGSLPMTLGGATVTVTDSTGAKLPAAIAAAAPAQLVYQVPASAAAGPATVTITAGAQSVSGKINVVSTYPSLYPVSTSDAMDVSSGPVSFTIYGTGIGTATVTVTVAGVDAPVQSSGPAGTTDGVDQVTFSVPASLAGSGRVPVVVTAAGKPSNPVYLVIQ